MSTFYWLFSVFHSVCLLLSLLYSQYFTFSTSSCSCSQSTLNTVTQLWQCVKDCCCGMIVIVGRECVCLYVTSSSAHLTPPHWSLSLTPQGNSPLQSWIFHFTTINHSWHWTDKPVFSRHVSVIRPTWYMHIVGQVVCQIPLQRH